MELLRRTFGRRTGVARLDKGSLLFVTAAAGFGIGGAFLLEANVPSATIGAGVAPIRWLCFAAGVTAIVGGTLIAAIAAIAGPREVLVSRTVKDLTAGSGFSFDDQGEHELKGVPEHWQLYRAGA